MSPRVGGAIMALIAAALLAVSIATSAWWSGAPEINGAVSSRRAVHIGLIKAEGCFVTDDVDSRCSQLEVGGQFTVTKYIELAAVGALAIGLLGLGITALRTSASRRTFSKIVLGAAGASAIVAIALLLQGPDIKNEGKSVPMTIPLGYGMFCFFGGTGLGIIGGLLAPAADREKRLMLRPTPVPVAARQQLPTPQPVLDVLALLQEDALRPAALGPEPMMGRQQMPPSPGGMLAGPSGPLAPPQAQPLFSAAPQLRPLYEAAPNQGGTGGFVPGMAPPPPIPNRGPTPMPHAAVSALAGIPTPPPMDVPQLFSPLAPSPQIAGAVLPPPTPAAQKLPPPSRTKPLTAPPPPRPSQSPIGQTTPPRSQPTIATAAVPPPAPTTPSTIAGMMPQLPPRSSSDLEAETIDRDFDAAATVSRDEAQQRLPSVTDPNLATGDSTSPSVEFETATSESRSFGSEVSTDVSHLEDSIDDQMETRAREKVSTTDVQAVVPPPEPAPEPAARPSASVITSAAPPAAKIATAPQPKITGPAPITKVPTIPPLLPAIVPPPPQPKVPISTASSSLPPPSEKQAASSGPSPACPQCEAPMAWVEEHLRFYCKSCRMYF